MFKVLIQKGFLAFSDAVLKGAKEPPMSRVLGEAECSWHVIAEQRSEHVLRGKLDQ